VSKKDNLNNKTEEVEDVEEELQDVEEIEDKTNAESASEDFQGESDDELNLMKDKFIRLQADFSNYKRRTENEKKDYIDLGVEKVVLGLLPIIDNFERALSMSDEKNSFTEGIDMIYGQLIELLEKNDVKEIEALDSKFDPNTHHAVLVEPKEGTKEGIVIEVLQKGYKLGEKVLRPAMVKVSQ